MLTPGQQVEVAPYMVRFISLNVTQDSQKQMVTAQVEAFKNGKSLGRMFPARWFYNGREGEPTTEVALRRGFADDLNLVLAGYDPDGPTILVRAWADATPVIDGETVTLVSRYGSVTVE